MGYYFYNVKRDPWGEQPIIRCAYDSRNMFSISGDIFHEICNKYYEMKEYPENMFLRFGHTYMSGYCPRNKIGQYKEEFKLEKIILEEIKSEIASNPKRFWKTFTPKKINKIYSFEQFLVDLIHPIFMSSNKFECEVLTGAGNEEYIFRVDEKINKFFSKIKETVFNTDVKNIKKVESRLSEVIIYTDKCDVKITKNNLDYISND